MSSLAPAVVKASLHTETGNANIVATIATSSTDSERLVISMDKAYRGKLESYMASMMQAKKMLKLGIISQEEYGIIATMMDKKYGISLCSLYRGIDLIYEGFRGSMSHYQEVI